MPYEERNKFMEYQIEDALRFYGESGSKEDIAYHKKMMGIKK